MSNEAVLFKYVFLNDNNKKIQISVFLFLKNYIFISVFIMPIFREANTEGLCHTKGERKQKVSSKQTVRPLQISN